MRKFTPIIVAATVLLAAPAAGQEAENQATATTLTNTSTATETGAGTTNNLDSDAALATAPTNGLTAGPGTPPESTEPVIDQSYSQRNDDDRFPWGLLGLLGLAGLIPRKPRERADGR